jgi:hypothetical protein
MNQGFVSTIISAIVGGVIGAGVVFFAGLHNNVDLAYIESKIEAASNIDLDNLEVRNLRVTSLIVADHAAFLNRAGVPEIILKDGSIVAENVILAKKLVGRQMQGHAIVANRMFTTPDDLFATPMENWRFFAEIGASSEAGGEIVIRNANGSAMVNQPTRGGALLRMGFDTEAMPQIFALQNFNRSILPIRDDLSDAQRQMLNASMAQPQGMMPHANNGFDSHTAAPIAGQMPDATTLPPIAPAQAGGTNNIMR